ncbi:tannase/feruloyl esterase family alpha/beta hydrolase [Pseudofrankia inefficax]|uniref:Tannase and feruloyl esterase n=1 Tax=Pseudofrankia inefficax (strain DSM 45817 / CECT 9037 / DDB 130130 / EuI1c) TaxID=298654 RepID=E3J833_PSEI1|nr:tannase/feruloyl esterase family alpha/beta hydrolase [Pseudofrankia inefficax]ADP82081.1 Tannase and feruloyl esterase [Pseudofrankia inefficax]
MDTTFLAECAERAFGTDELVRVLLVTSFRAGEPLVLSETPAAYTPNAPADLFLVKLLVGPGNPGPADAPSTSPGIGIEVWLPPKNRWNGRVHNIGGLGGYDGGRHASPTEIGWFYAALTAGGEGAVSASTDSGHALTNGAWGMNPDGTPATQLWIDFAHRAMHEMAVRSKALAEVFYGAAPRRCYYEGSSTGGRHGYRLAQQYPDDYDGIIANLPTINFSEWALAGLYRHLVIERDLDGVALTEEQMDLASNAAIHAGDLVGGEHLGYIFDNEACRYDPSRDPAVLSVSDGGTNTSPDALTTAQARAVNKIWYGVTDDGSVPDAAADSGVDVALGGRRWYGMARGTSLYVAYFTKHDPRMREILRERAASGDVPGADQAALILQDPSIAGPSFENASGKGEGRWRDFSYARLADLFDRAAEMEPAFAHIASDNPDLTAFQARGGKFLSWHGWNDESIPIQTTMRYYDRVVETMGGLQNVQSFFRLYIVPGGGHMSPHGTSNEQANPPIFGGSQLYGLLVDWVENGVEPGNVTITSPVANPTSITHPIGPYPARAVYTGGDPRAASSFVISGNGGAQQ